MRTTPFLARKPRHAGPDQEVIRLTFLLTNHLSNNNRINAFQPDRWILFGFLCSYELRIGQVVSKSPEHQRPEKGLWDEY